MVLGTVMAVAFTACGGSSNNDESAARDATANTEAPADIGDGSLTGADSAATAPDTTDAPANSSAGALGNADVAGTDLTNLGRDIAIEMHVTMTSEDLRRTVQGIMRSAAAHGGAVFASDIDYGVELADDGGEMPDDAAVTGRATLTVKVPAAELGAVLTGLDELGTVRSTNQQAQDVTDQLVDLSVRIRNAEQSVDRVREFLEATTDLRQMVDLEGELTRRQTDLEQLLATQANVTERVALSTLTIDVYPASAAPDPVEDDNDGISDAFQSGWNAFLGVLFAVGFVLAILAPFLLLAALVLAVTWIVARPLRRRPMRRDTATATGGDAVSNDVSDDEDLARANRPG